MREDGGGKRGEGGVVGMFCDSRRHVHGGGLFQGGFWEKNFPPKRQCFAPPPKFVCNGCGIKCTESNNFDSVIIM